MEKRTTGLSPIITRTFSHFFVKTVTIFVLFATNTICYSEILTVSLRHDNFEPTEKDLTLTDIFPGTVIFSESKPPGISVEPTYQGQNQRYAAVNLGNKNDQRFYVVLDYIDVKSPVCYFDTNKNGNMTDDGGPISTDLDYFSIFNIEIPCSTVFDGVNWKSDLKIHLSASPANTARGVYTLSVSTVLQGQIEIEGATYDAYIADSRQNDADFTNDGIVIDLNGNGTIERKDELFPPNSLIRVNGKDYDLDIIWDSKLQAATRTQPSLTSSPSAIHIPIILRPLVFLLKIAFR